MRLINYVAGSAASWGLIVDDGIVDLGRDPYAEMPDIPTAMATSNLMDIAMISVGKKPDVGLGEARLLSPLHGVRHVAYVSPRNAESVTLRPVGAHCLAAVDARLPAVTEEAVAVRVYIAALIAHVQRELQGDPLEAVACFACLVSITSQVSSAAPADRQPTLTVAGPSWISRDEASFSSGRVIFTATDGVGGKLLHRAEVTAEQLNEALRWASAYAPLAPGDVIAVEGLTVTIRPNSCQDLRINELSGLRISLTDSGAEVVEAPRRSG